MKERYHAAVHNSRGGFVESFDIAKNLVHVAGKKRYVRARSDEQRVIELAKQIAADHGYPAEQGYRVYVLDNNKKTEVGEEPMPVL